MFRLDADLQVYLHRNAVDFRLGINGLVALVEQSMQLDLICMTQDRGALSGIAGIAGAIAGSVIGSQAIGGGRGRYVAAAIAGPVAGLAAQQLAARASNPARPGYEIVVRTDMGRLVAVTQDADQPFAPGDRVMLVSNGGAMRVTR
ncbi:IS66 family insertion sequence element accessory protein TnpB [Cupriavidus sp. CuC1]|uniref:IS66 family insertion sequence element accessory protein TnpB n=1 Tax=Cupriavidus sp. CuC1 TaxID=3373131 RepID=UPI0037CF7CCB